MTYMIFREWSNYFTSRNFNSNRCISFISLTVMNSVWFLFIYLSYHFNSFRWFSSEDHISVYPYLLIIIIDYVSWISYSLTSVSPPSPPSSERSIVLTDLFSLGVLVYRFRSDFDDWECQSREFCIRVYERRRISRRTVFGGLDHVVVSWDRSDPQIKERRMTSGPTNEKIRDLILDVSKMTLSVSNRTLTLLVDVLSSVVRATLSLVDVQLELHVMIVYVVSALDPEVVEKTCTPDIIHKYLTYVRVRDGHFEYRLWWISSHTRVFFWSREIRLETRIKESNRWTVFFMDTEIYKRPESFYLDLDTFIRFWSWGAFTKERKCLGSFSLSFSLSVSLLLLILSIIIILIIIIIFVIFFNIPLFYKRFSQC